MTALSHHIDLDSNNGRSADLFHTPNREELEFVAPVPEPDDDFGERHGSHAKDPSVRDTLDLPAGRPGLGRGKRSLSEVVNRGDKPLKGCMKKKVKSAESTPPPGSDLSSESSPGGAGLRKAKTVEFEPRASLLPPPSPLREQVDMNPNQMPAPENSALRNVQSNHKAMRPIQTVKQLSLPATRRKGLPAEAAITRADVHVVAVVPVRSSGFLTSTTKSAPTPTMQVVETSSARYEVIWDDIGEDKDMRTQRRRSSASESLQAATAGPPTVIERVSSKLTELAWGSSEQQVAFSPQFVVFPDQNARESRTERSTEGDNTLPIYAPPNSEYASRSPSCDDTNIDPDLRPTKSSATPNDVNNLPSARPGHAIGAARGARIPDRPLTYAEGLGFRYHRDSVLLAKEKKKFHSEHGPSSARRVSYSDVVASEPLATIQDSDGEPLAPEGLGTGHLVKRWTTWET
ncbi:hypothetical protein M011DRAFT_248060 [Sporormia fimetaria CBS 119925]|uniref:Uncharacterized protein n=1 Tax=Sporormia fimetaria CBS 119925 TaxID=1340428 RepID=A0A6A6UZH6_9PLEO|nr:hypothetical protein M011DRAFT_248060 [Sporormia fimetaria CBS 119925]